MRLFAGHSIMLRELLKLYSFIDSLMVQCLFSTYSRYNQTLLQLRIRSEKIHPNLLHIFLQNCSYYWGFAFYIGYYVNHPLYTPPLFGSLQINIGLIGFILSELGNFSIHIALRNLRPAGTRERKIPVPTINPFTILFNFVSCPNYTYEVYSWIFFTIMTQCLPAGLFAAAGFFQMTLWAFGKHRNYKKEFPNYPKGRKAIIPFLL